MDNQHKLIKGYRDLPQEDIDLMNEVKEMGLKLKALHDKIDAHLNTQAEQFIEARNDSGLEDWSEQEPFKWLDEGKTQLQKGLMFLTRAIAQPTGF